MSSTNDENPTTERQEQLLDQRLSVVHEKAKKQNWLFLVFSEVNAAVRLISVVSPLVLSGGLGGAAIGVDPIKVFLSTEAGQWLAFSLALLSATVSGLQVRQKFPEMIEQARQGQLAYQALFREIERFDPSQHTSEETQLFLERIDNTLSLIDQESSANSNTSQATE